MAKKKKAVRPFSPIDAAPNTQPAITKRGALFTVVCYLIVVAVGWCCFVVHRGDPPYLFWDENYHVTSAERYLHGIAFFETHPPLAKMLIALGEGLSGANRNVDTHLLVTKKRISGDDLPKNFSFSGMRLVPALFGVLGGLAFFSLMRELFDNRLHALLLTGLYLFENAFTVHFRAVHLDSFQICFAIVMLWQFVRLWKLSLPLHPLDYAGLAFWAGLAVMVKVNGVVLLAALPILYFRDAARQPDPPVLKRIGDFLSKSGAATAAFSAVIFCVFWIHAALTPNMPDPRTPAGSGDLANMSPEYRSYLAKHSTLTPALVARIIYDNFRFMEKDNEGVPKLDTSNPSENGSNPMHWPFHDRNINYRWDSADGKTAYVELIGNQLAWYSSTAAVMFSLLLVSNRRIFRMSPPCTPQTYSLIEAFTLLYIIFMIVNLLLASQRVMYLYHYFIGLVIAYVLLALMWQYMSEVNEKLARVKTWILAGVMTAYFASYVFFLPLSNHWPLTKAECERRNIWISHILDCR